MIDAQRKGKITPSMMVSGPCPVIACVPFERGAMYLNNQNYAYLNLAGLFGDTLKPHTSGKLICPKCRT